MRHINLIYCLLLISISSLAQTKPQYQTYTNAKKGISIKIPVNWKKAEAEGAIFFFKRPKEEPHQQFAENISLIINPPDDLTLEEYATLAQQKLKEQIVGYQQLQTDFIKINNRDFFRIIYTFPYQNLIMHDMYYITVKDGQSYDFICSAIEPTFKKFFPVFEKIIKSFKFK